MPDTQEMPNPHKNEQGQTIWGYTRNGSPIYTREGFEVARNSNNLREPTKSEASGVIGVSEASETLPDQGDVSGTPSTSGTSGTSGTSEKGPGFTGSS